MSDSLLFFVNCQGNQMVHMGGINAAIQNQWQVKSFDFVPLPNSVDSAQLIVSCERNPDTRRVSPFIWRQQLYIFSHLESDTERLNKEIQERYFIVEQKLFVPPMSASSFFMAVLTQMNDQYLEEAFEDYQAALQ